MDRWLLMVAKLTMKRYGIEVIKRETKFQRFIMHNLPINRLVFKQRSQKNVLIESFFKWFYRQPLYWGYGIQIIVFNSLVLLLMNVSISIIVSIVCLWILHTYYKSLWARFIMHAFMNLYSWPASFHAKKAIQKSILIGYSIFIVLFIIAKILWLPSNMMESILHVVYDM